MLKDAIVRAVQENYQETRQLAVMFLANETPGLSVRELASALSIPKPSVTRSIEALERDGLVVRKLNLDDRRLIKLHLTDAGRASLRRITTGEPE